MLTVNNHLGTTSATRCITVEGFKSIERVEEMPLNPINILIGPNGAGKTNLSFRRIGPDRLPSSFWKSPSWACIHTPSPAPALLAFP